MNGATRVRVGLWGANASGKTTFLSAMLIAALRSGDQGTWMVAGDDTTSRQWVSQQTSLLRQHRLPPASQRIEPLNLIVDGQPGGGLLRQARSWLLYGTPRVALRLEVLDGPGLLYDSRQSFGIADRKRVVDHLSASHGLLYLFDSTRPHGDSFEFFGGILSDLWTTAGDEGRLTRDHKLPHCVAVCVTKFDDPRVFEPARRARLVFKDEDSARTPRVPFAQAREFFHGLATADGDDMIVSSLASYFEPGRVAYFATSAVGFLTGARGTVDLDDYTNVNIVAGQAEIRGLVRPINVLEPLLWLEQTVRAIPRRP